MVRSILFKVKLKGHGVVNTDSTDQKFVWNAFTRDMEHSRHDNVMFAKHRWYEDGQDDQGNKRYKRKIVISGDCLRHNIFVDDFLYQSPNVFAHRLLMNKMIATPASLLRGYMFTQEGQTCYRKKSAVNITEAEQTNNAVSTIETFSRSGKKEVRQSEDDAADNSFFKKEVVGDMTYESFGSIDLRELQFVSMSELYDRMALNSDDYADFYKPFLEKAMGSTLGEPAYYIINGSAIETPEFGVLLNGEQIQFLAREFFKRLLRTSISKASNGHAHVTEVTVKYVQDPLADTFDSTEGWKRLSSEGDVSFKPHFFYKKIDTSEAENILKAVEEEQASRKTISAEKKKAEKEEKAAKKAKKA